MFKKLFPGLLAAVVAGTAGILLSPVIPYTGSVSLALIFGLVLGNLYQQKQKLKDGISFTDKKLLPFTIALMGVELSPDSLLSMGEGSLLLLVTLVLLVLIAGYVTAGIFGFSKKQALLLGCGNAICGSSAVLSLSKIINSKEEETGLAVAAVNFMGTIGLFLLPLLGMVIGYSDQQQGLLIGGGLQAVGQVVASGYSVSDSAGAFAVVFKMGRVLMLGPVIAGIGLLLMRKGSSGNKKSGSPFPIFIIGFFILMIINSFGLIPEIITSYFSLAIDILLPVAMAGIGMNISFRAIRKSGTKIIFAEIFIMVIQILLLITGIYLLS